MLETADSLALLLEKERGLWSSLERALKQYRDTLAAGFPGLDFGRLFGEGLILSNAVNHAKRSTSGGNAFPLTPEATVLADSLLQMHGPLLMASRDGQTLVSSAREYDANSEDLARQRTLEEELARSLATPTAPVTDEVREHLLQVTEPSANRPELRQAYVGALVRNAAIVVVGGAVLATVASAAIPGASLPAIGAYLALLVGSESIKKSKAAKSLSDDLARMLDFVTGHERQLHALAKEDQVVGLKGILDWFDEHKPMTSRREPSFETTERVTRRRVVIIEPDAGTAKRLIADLSGEPLEIAGVARTKTEAIRLAEESHPDIIISEVVLADGSSGVDALNEILQARSVVTVFLTSYPERLLTAPRPEPTVLVTKPYTRSMLVEMLKTALPSRPATHN